VELSSTIRALVTTKDTALSIYMPTHTFGSETISDASKFNALLNVAAKQLADSGLSQSEVESVIGPVRGITSPDSFWQHRSEGLAIFASKDQCVHFTLPYTVQESVVVSSHFHLRHVIPFLTDNATFFVLQLSQNTVRLFEADAYTITPIDHKDLPPSMEEALQHEDPERQLQMRSTGNNTMGFHGHGAGDEIDKAAIERFLRAVDQGVVTALHGRNEPLVLAAVSYFLPIYQSISRYGHVHSEMITGSPERSSEDDLRREGWGIISPSLIAKKARATNEMKEVIGTGRTTSSLAEIVEAGSSGRIETLFVDVTSPLTSTDDDLLNAAIAYTLSHSGAVMSTHEEVDPDNPGIALLRY
jgi:hypothetical protein